MCLGVPHGSLDVPCSPEEVLQRFSELAMAHNHSIPREQLQEFVQRYFQPVGQELQSWIPEDWTDRYHSGEKTGTGSLSWACLHEPGGVIFSSPQFLQKVSDAKLRAWAKQLHQIWKKLGKKVSVAWACFMAWLTAPGMGQSHAC